MKSPVIVIRRVRDVNPNWLPAYSSNISLPRFLARSGAVIDGHSTPSCCAGFLEPLSIALKLRSRDDWGGLEYALHCVNAFEGACANE